MKKYSFSKIIAMVAVTSFTLAACDHKKEENTSTIPEISAENIEAHVTFLAADAMLGRDTGSKEYTIAANYVAGYFSQLGLEPIGENASYFQSVPFHNVKINGVASSLSIGDRTFTLGEDYLMGGNSNHVEGTASAPVVFVGYGIDAPALGVNDYEGLDVTGKIVLILNGKMPTLPSEAAAHYGRDDTKESTAIAKGAVGVLMMVAPTSRRDFDAFKQRANSPDGRLDIVRDGFDMESTSTVTAMVSPILAATLIAGSGHDYYTVMEQAKVGPVKGFDLNSSVTMTQKTDFVTAPSSLNVAAVLRGSDPVLRDEYIIISAHLDHIGWRPEMAGDNIYNGALDNAAGIATMMEAARAFSKGKQAPKRSIIFLAVTAEEKGLLGADYFAHIPTVPKETIKANVNLDMPVLLYDFADLIAFGSDHSTIGPIVDAALSKIGVKLSADPMPEEGIFTRSDHYRFVQQGIPSVMMATGWTSIHPDNPMEGKEKFMGFLEKDYHSPRDQIDQGINWQAGAKFALANYLIIEGLANADAAPLWYEGDVFGNIFAKQAAKAPVTAE
jgi:hypothetical protein